MSRSSATLKRPQNHHRSARWIGVLMVGLALPMPAGAYDCMLEPAQVVEIRSAVEGLITRIHVQRGDDVRAGQILVELDSTVERSSAAVARYRSTAEGRIEASRNRMVYAVRKTDRSNELHSKQFISAQERDQAETEKNLAESDLKEAMEARELARLELQRAIDILNQKTLRSPFDGIVIDRMLNPGDLAEAGNGRKPILRLAQIDPLHVEVVLPLETFGKLRPGMSAQVFPESGGEYRATVRIVDRVFDAASGTYGARLELPNPKRQLPGGIRCRIEFSNATAGLGPDGRTGR